MFVEDIDKRAKKAKNFTDDADPNKHACVGTIAPLHYESVKDSGVFDAEIDLTARNINEGNYRGLNATHNNFHYRYGRLNNQPGWTGFGGRQGEHWFYFKATGMGFMRSRHAGWTAIGSPNYRSVNESHTVGTTELIQGVEVKNSLEVIQQDVWPGVDITWRVGGDSLKEQIEIDSTAWADIKQRAASMDSAYRFGFSFDLDTRDIPKMRDVTTRRAFTLTEGFDGTSTDTFELLNDEDELLAFLPIDKAWVEDAEGNVIEGSERTLLKEFYRYSNRNHLYVGLSVDDLLSMPDGHKVVFDPTVDTQVGTTANDGYGNTTVFTTTGHTLYTGYTSPPGLDNIAFALFTGITIEGTIDTSYTSWWSYSNADTTGYDVNVAAEDTDNPSAPTTWTDLNGRTLTTAKANWTKTTGWASAGFENTPSLNGSLQELVDTYTISSDNVLILITNNSGTGLKQFREYTNDSAKAPKLYVEYSTGNTAPTIALNTADGASLSTTPTLAFTGSDVDSDDLTYEIQISTSGDFTATDGDTITDNLETGSGVVVHPQPISTTSQIDDRPGQSFTGNGGKLKQAQFRIIDLGSYDPWGDILARVYAHSGTYGTSSAPENAAAPANTPTSGWLAQSGLEAVDDPSTAYWATLDFTGDQQVRLAYGTKYVVILDWLPDTFVSTNTFGVQGTTTAGDHDGNMYNDGASVNNGSEATWNTWFRITEEHDVVGAASASDSGFSGTPDNTDPFAAGQQVSYTVQAADTLQEGTTYYWRVRVKDPSGTNEWTAYSASRSFITSGGSTQFATALDGIEFSESTARIATYAGVATDGINFSETPTNLASLLATSTDGVDFSDTVLAGLLIQSIAADGVTLSEALEGLVALIGISEDSLTLSEALAVVLYAQGVSQDQVVLSDSALVSATLNGLASDAMTLSETLATVTMLLAAAQDGFTLSELIEADQTGLLEGIIQEGFQVGDTPLSETHWIVDVLDAFTLGEIVIGDLPIGVLEGVVLDGLVFSDTGEVNATFDVTVTDQAIFAETIATLMAYGVIVTDGFTIGDTIAHLLPTGQLSVTFRSRNATITFKARQPRISTRNIQ